jgi:hypothetical protein
VRPPARPGVDGEVPHASSSCSGPPADMARPAAAVHCQSRTSPRSSQPVRTHRAAGSGSSASSGKPGRASHRTGGLSRPAGLLTCEQVECCPWPPRSPGGRQHAAGRRPLRQPDRRRRGAAVRRPEWLVSIVPLYAPEPADSLITLFDEET